MDTNNLNYCALRGGSMPSPAEIRRVWLLTFEYSGIVKVGGLGEAVATISRELTERGLDVTVIMPSHGLHPEGVKEIGDVPCRGVRQGIDGGVYPYDIGFLEGYVGKVRTILVGEKDGHQPKILSSRPPYSYASEKACLLARAVLCLSRAWGFPDLVHINDWHSALAGALLKTVAESEGYSLPLLYHIHLRGSPSYPWHYASEDWCGLPDTDQRVWAFTKHERVSTRALWDSCWGSVECFIVKLADAVATVSRSELEKLVHDYGSWLRGKSCYIYNATPWSLKEVEDTARKLYGSANRAKIRWEALSEILRSAGSWGDIGADREVLVVSSGRLTPQKGFDTLVKAAKLVPSTIKILVLGKRVGDTDYENYLRGLAEELWGRVAIVYEDIDPSLYKLSLYIAHTYALLSRYEPFGISYVEALAVGTPIVAPDSWGPSEYVADLRVSPLGVGLRVPPDDILEIARAIQSLGYMMFYAESDHGLDKVVYKELREILAREPKYGERVREVAVDYVESYFRPKHTANNTLTCYELARQMAYFRAHTP